VSKGYRSLIQPQPVKRTAKVEVVAAVAADAVEDQTIARSVARVRRMLLVLRD
jgi:hypothetical protein